MIPKFDTIKERNKWIVSNKKRLIELKKATIKQSDNVNLSSAELVLNKSINKKDTENTIYRTIVGNTYGWMDSHDDVHIKGIFTKTIKEKGDKVLHLHDHVQQLTAEVGDNLKVYEQEVEWKDVSLNKVGKTTALLMDTAVQKDYNSIIFNKYKANKIQQHSVGMQYVKVELAINDSEETEEFETWNKYIGQVANSEQAIKQGYFFAVLEAKLIEISAVIQGSNELTPTFPTKTKLEEAKELLSSLDEEELKEISYIYETKPSNHLDNEEPSADTQKEQLTKTINFKEFLK